MDLPLRDQRMAFPPFPPSKPIHSGQPCIYGLDHCSGFAYKGAMLLCPVFLANFWASFQN